MTLVFDLQLASRMPTEKTKKRARRDKAQGKSASTQAGEFVREEIHHVREGKHGARSPQQAIAIGLSKARRAGVDLPPPKRGKAKPKTRRSAERAYARGHGAAAKRKSSPRRARATHRALEHEGHSAASPGALSRHAKTAAARRSPTQRKAAARKGAQTRRRRAHA
ncbi:MAG TPA: DUF6496 domain-containing protein [Polyangiaceae bacterium]